MDKKIFDLAVIGGGINGAGIARDAAGRGLSVVLCEKDDLASATSSASTKLIHGGLRYLEYLEFKLVREALKEREVLLRAAPHIIWPLEFILPHDANQRPFWMVRAGLFLYDWLGGRRTLKASRGLNLATSKVGAPLNPEFRKGFSYADCWVEDSRLVVLNAISAFEHGAKILTRTECTALETDSLEGDMLWRVRLKSHRTGEEYEILARAVVNAAGPWVAGVLGYVPRIRQQHHPRLVRGSHIIVPQLYTGSHAYILQNRDKRVVFAIPYERKFTLIGTTEVDTESVTNPQVTEEETLYLCDVINRYFRKGVKPENVVWSYSGVRPLVDDAEDSASAVTRDYILDLDRTQGAPILSVYGGKITTYRTLSETAVSMITEVIRRGGRPWTRTEALPGGNFNTADFATFFNIFRKEFHWLSDDLAFRYARAYGARARKMLRGCVRASDMGEYFGEEVFEREIRYLIEHEWARTLDDILWRRSKLGLHISDKTKDNISKFLKSYHRRKKKEQE